MLSVIIPAKNETYLERTIRNVLENARGEIEVIAVLDGYLPDPPINVGDPRVVFLHYEQGIGQRAAINEAARRAKGEFIMKLDAHCAVDEGFDVKLAADCDENWTVIPRMYNLDHETWKPKLHKMTDYMYIGSDDGRLLRAEYYGSRQTKNDKLIDDTMCCMGPGWFMHKKRFFEQGGCDEGHEGGWGQQGVEVSCKAWLSGGALKVNKKTWFAHWFRGGGGPGFPYKISGNQIERVRRYSRDMWLNNKWPKQVRQFQWLLDKFDPPGWIKDLTILYYTANVIEKGIEYSVLRSLRKHGFPIISVSQEPMDLGKNIVVPKERSLKNIYRQVLIAAKAASTEFVALCEDDCLYVPEHFKYRPKEKPFAYNLNRWLLHLDVDEPTFSYRRRPVLSQCIARREDLIKYLEARPDNDKEMGRDGEPGYETFETKDPNLVICHDKNTSGRKLLGHDGDLKQELQPWGTVSYWVEKFKKRGVRMGRGAKDEAKESPYRQPKAPDPAKTPAVTVIIPSRDEHFLDNTIKDVLANATGDVEVIVVLDGYDTKRLDDPRLKYLCLPNNGEMQKRQGINAAVSIARGKFVMSLDAHCMVAKGFDEVLARDCADNWIMIPRRYKLEPLGWTTKKDGSLPVDYEYWIKGEFDKRILKPYRWDQRAIERKDLIIDDTLTMQASCWFMRRDFFKRMGFMRTDGYTGWGQEDVELVMETWLAGGRVVVNKATWYAHLFKGKTFGRYYKMNQDQHKASRQYAFDHWCDKRKDDFYKVLKQFAPIPNWDL